MEIICLLKKIKIWQEFSCQHVLIWTLTSRKSWRNLLAFWWADDERWCPPVEGSPLFQDPCWAFRPARSSHGQSGSSSSPLHVRTSLGWPWGWPACLAPPGWPRSQEPTHLLPKPSRQSGQSCWQTDKNWMMPKRTVMLTCFIKPGVFPLFSRCTTKKKQVSTPKIAWPGTNLLLKSSCFFVERTGWWWWRMEST